MNSFSIGYKQFVDWVQTICRLGTNNLKIACLGNARKDDLKALSEVAPAGNSKGLGSIKRVSEANGKYY